MPARKRIDSQPETNLIEVSVGRTTVKIYPRGAERGRKPCFKIADYSSGKRRFLSFLDEKDARTEAARIASRLNAGDAAGAAMTGDDRALLLRATELVAPFNLDAQTACTLFAEGAKLVGPHNVVAACEAFAKRSPASRERVLLEVAVRDYIEAKAADAEGQRSSRHLADLRSRLGRFAEENPGKALENFATADIQKWIDKLKRGDGQPVSRQSRRNFRTVLSGFFDFYRRRGAVQENPCKDLEKGKKAEDGEIEFWSPEEAESLLRAMPESSLPAFVLSLFCGIRSAEATRIQWKHVNFAEQHVEITAEFAKTGSRRLIPISDNAMEWLLPLAKSPKERVFSEYETNFVKRVSEAAKTAGVRRVQNGARHSFVTYRAAFTGDVPRTAAEAGNSPKVVLTHYRGLASKAKAEAFFNIRPQRAENVVPMRSASN